MFVGLGVVMVTVAFGLITYFFKKQGKDARPVALDSQKKIPFKLIDKKVFKHQVVFYFVKQIIMWLKQDH